MNYGFESRITAAQREVLDVREFIVFVIELPRNSNEIRNLIRKMLTQILLLVFCVLARLRRW
jgi:hypothetical protein